MVRSFHHADFPLERLLERKTAPVTVVLPALEVADTVGSIVERALALGGLVDQVLVIDGASEDCTAEVAAGAGAEVHQQDELVPELGPVLGKGDAMWRALAAVRGEFVVYLDADTRDFDAQFVTGLLGPLLMRHGARFVKAAYRRPFAADGVELPEGGGRVSQLTARPLLAGFYPDLGNLVQPLAGEVAARREVFERVPFSTGYAVETAMLLDLREQLGAGAIVQVDVGERRNDHQPLDALRPMAEIVLAVVCDRLRREGRLLDEAAAKAVIERPPYGADRDPVQASSPHL